MSIINPYSTFPIYAKIKEKNVWNTTSIVVNNMLISTTINKVIYNQSELDQLELIKKYLVLIDATELKEAQKDTKTKKTKTSKNKSITS